MSFKPYYSGWSLDTTDNLDTVTTIHHPWGGVKKISVDTTNRPTVATYNDGIDIYATNGHWQIYKWDTGVTERGSSGAPLFDKNHRIVGSLSGGDAACGYPYNDYFERLDKSFSYSSQSSEQLKSWLDPDNSGVTHINGFNPFPFQNYGCDTISNIGPTEKSVILPFEYGTGFYSGNNSDSISQYAEYFESKDSIYLTGVNFNIGKTGTSGGLTIRVREGNNLPGTIIFETYISYNSMQKDSLNYFEFYPEIKLSGNFFISYDVSYIKGDTFSLYQAAQRFTDSKNTAYLFYKGSWVPFKQYTAGFWGSSLDIRSIYCNEQPTSINEPNRLVKLKVYPCPANQVLNVVLPNGKTNIVSLKVIDFAGREIPVNFKLNRNIIVVNLNNQKPGFYVIKVNTRSCNYFSKFIKI